MTLRKLLWGVLGVGATVSVVLFIWTIFGSYTVRLTQQELQDKIDAKMPHTTAKHSITVHKATLDLTDDKLGVAVEASTTKWKTDLSAKASTAGTLSYDREKGAFFFVPDALKLDEVTIAGKKVPTAIINTTQKGLDGKLLDAAQGALERVPVYRLPDNFKANVAKLVIEKVEVKGGVVTAELKFWRLTTAVFSYAAAFVLLVILAILMMLNPEFGMAELFFASLGGGGGGGD